MTFELPPLPYPREALEPHVSAETLDYHHGKHHAAYVKKLNELLTGSGLEGSSLETIIQRSNDDIFNNAAQHWNHSFYWHCLSPRGGQEPRGGLADGIVSTWGSLDAFKKAFGEVAVGTFGSGWAWLVERKGQLAIVSTKDAETPIASGERPLLTCDVWEHAYYIDHRNDRASYVQAYWNVVDWDFAAKNLGEPWAIDKAAARTS